MKHLFLTILTMCVLHQFNFAQSPKLFNYQGIARDATGNPLISQSLSLKLSILPTSDATLPEYEETQIIKTNEFGLYTLQIGNGQVLSGEMNKVRWETGNKYIKVSIDPNGGHQYVDAVLPNYFQCHMHCMLTKQELPLTRVQTAKQEVEL